MPLNENLTAFFGDFTVTATWTPASPGAPEDAQVIFDAVDDEVSAGRQISTTYSITYPYTIFVGLKHGDTVTIGGVPYKAHQPRKIDDGALVQTRLSKS